jgi:hypothetical protein
MLSKQIFELFQVLIVMAAFPKLCSTILFPCRAKLLHRIPLPAQVFPYFSRFERSSGSRSIPVNVQTRKPGSSLRLIQCPGNFVISCGPWSTAIRHDTLLGQCSSKPGPENTNDEVILARIRNLFREVVSLQLRILPKAWTQNDRRFVAEIFTLNANFALLLRSSQWIGIGGVYLKIKLRGNRTNQLFRYSTFPLYVCGGRNEYVDRSHVDGSASIRFSSNRTEILPNLCSIRLESRKKPVRPAAMFKLVRRFLLGTSPFFSSPQRRPISFFVRQPHFSSGLARSGSRKTGIFTKIRFTTFQEDKAIASHFLICGPV